jgi:plasmid stabilization system protein ParE
MRLTWRDEALDDLQRVFEFNAAHSEQHAMRVDRRLIERCHALLTTPNLGRRTNREGVLRLSVTDIQYVIDYQPAEDRIRIVRIQSSREIR